MTATHPQLILQNGSTDRTITLEEYRHNGGYEGLKKALNDYSPNQVKEIVLDSGLRGYGGAGFSTGKKWSFIGEDATHPRYVIANTDEMEPGTFKDRVMVGVNPHSLIEGMIIASYAISSNTGIFFFRPSYESVADIFTSALHEAREAGFLGHAVMETRHTFDIKIHRSAGRYICGETKGLVNALEGKRPHPNIEGHLTSKGLWGKPTLINNAETFSFVPPILREGAAWFRGLGKKETAPGNKIYSVSGKVNRPGVYELPFGTPLREIIEDSAGGMKPGSVYKTCLPGGASTQYLPKEYYDSAMDFDSLEKIGYRLGTGAIVVFDQDTCLVGATLNLIEFFSRESCGWCTPCREGLPFIRDLLRRIEQGEGRGEFIPMLKEMCRYMPNAYCAFATGAAAPVEGLLESFIDEVYEHINQKRCPFNA